MPDKATSRRPPPAATRKATILEQRDSIFAAAERRTDPLAVLHAYSRWIDELLSAIFYDENLGREHACLIALGGYGRRELCPYSDIDILVLHDAGQDMEQIAAAVRKFWDTGLTMGCVVRTLEQCAAILGQDMATDTALLECTYIAGNRTLFERLRFELIVPYFLKKRTAYIAGMCEILRDGIFSSANTLFRVEPDLKNGICTLRDCQRLVWAERVRKGDFRAHGLHRLAQIAPPHLHSLAADYAFLTALRIELHLLCKRRMDILEIDLQPGIAEQYGFGPDGAGRLMEQFFRTVSDIRLHILSFLEKDLAGKNIWRSVRRRISAYPIATGLTVLDGIVFSTHKKIEQGAEPLWVMKLFQSALRHKATLSVELRNRIQRLSTGLTPHDFALPETGQIFREMLAWQEPVGAILQMMHETGILEKLISPFQALTCKVEYDSYHEFTIDQHILLAVKHTDELTQDPNPTIRANRRALEHPLILRTALLLHDIGKGQPGEHSQTGAGMVETICERLGFNDAEIEKIRYLVYHHLDLSRLSFMREPEETALRQFAASIGNRETLDLLYLLTIADIRSVGPRTWTDWKGFQLEQLYDRLLYLIEHPYAKQPREATEENLPVLDPSYLTETLPEDRSLHRRWLAEMDHSEGASPLHLHLDPFPGFERLTVCAVDRPGFLCDLIGCLTSEGYNILNARIYSTIDDHVLDIFYLEPSDRPVLAAEEKIRNVEKKWRAIEAREKTADELVAERIRRYPPAPLRRTAKQPLHIRINNIDSAAWTIIEIDAADNFGLLHRIVRCLTAHRVNIVTARLSTRADLAVDVFYVSDADGLKITDPTRLDKLKEDLFVKLSE